jgi:hypothetical protein
MLVPERWPVRQAQSSRPMLAGAGPSGKDTLRTRRRSVLRRTGAPWRDKWRAPAAPPSTRPVWACVVAHLVVVRAYSGATFGSRSAQVWRRQEQGRQRQRRTMTRSAMGAVAQGKSARVRGECPWMRWLGALQSGQVELVELIAATKRRRGSSMLRDCNVLWSSGGSKYAQRSSHVIRGVLPVVRGLNATDVFENTTIFIDLERWAPQVNSLDSGLFPRHHTKWPRA